jgi:hypothetical protein
MSKYSPTIEEYELPHPCFICGADVWGDAEICQSEFCNAEMESFRKDFEADQLDWCERLWDRSDRD